MYKYVPLEFSLYIYIAMFLNYFSSQFTIVDISQQKLRNLELINCSGEQCSPENPNQFLLSDIGHIKNGEQCLPLQKSF